MTSVLIIGGLVRAGVILAVVMSRGRGDGWTDLGTVSGQWLAEYRQSKES